MHEVGVHRVLKRRLERLGEIRRSAERERRTVKQQFGCQKLAVVLIKQGDAVCVPRRCPAAVCARARQGSDNNRTPQEISSMP